MNILKNILRKLSPRKYSNNVSGNKGNRGGSIFEWWKRLFKKKKIKFVKEFQFHQTYSLAQSVKDSIENDPYITLGNPKTLKKPNQYSLLHTYILEHIKLIAEYEIDKVGAEEDLHNYYKTTLDKYYVKYSEFKNWEKRNIDCDGVDYSIYLFQKIQDKCIKQIADEVFYILFGDREFLMNFNVCVSSFIKDLKFEDNPNVLKSDGVLKRPSRWDTWVVNAVKYRDKGKCVFCPKDLSGVVSPDIEPQIDHIVSLKEGGSNDITNLQYTCKDCNNSKRANTKTSKKYIPYY